MLTGHHVSAAANADEALLILGAALADHARDGSGLEELRAPLSRFCALARRERMAPEQMLIRLKRLFDGNAWPEKNSARWRDALREEFVALAISAFYADES